MRTHRKGGCYVRPLSEPIPFKMGLQIPRRVYSQAAAQGGIRKDAQPMGRNFPCLGAAERMPDSRRALDAGSCTYVHCDSAEAPGRLGDRVSKREERRRYGPTGWQGA